VEPHTEVHNGKDQNEEDREDHDELGQALAFFAFGGSSFEPLEKHFGPFHLARGVEAGELLQESVGVTADWRATPKLLALSTTGVCCRLSSP
jgi:hypothetical protein